MDRRFALATALLAVLSHAAALVPTATLAADKTPTPKVEMTGRASEELAPFDELMTSFITERKVPGAALAVVKDGRLVLARGYGWADRDACRPVQPDSLFRIASLSKAVTATAVLQLVEQGKLKLDAKVYDVLDLQRYAQPEGQFDPRTKQITILHLLQHTAGFDRDASFDPMFRSVRISKSVGSTPPAGPADIIRYMAPRPLDFTPGERFAYSNYGYCLLGRVIETISGEPYETYVRKHVLRPLGIKRMRIGKTLQQDRADGEVTYYAYDDGRGPAVMGEIGTQVPLPYGAWYLEAMDSHGAWLASAADMARFATAFDEPKTCSVLKAESVRTMFARPAGAPGRDEDGALKSFYYGCGWLVRPQGDSGAANHWHTGSLSGTAALMVRRHDGVNWVVLFNTRRGPEGQHLGRAIDGPLHEAANKVRRWPKADLFERLGVKSR